MGDTTNLVSAWKLDENGTTTPDAFGSNTLTENGAVVAVTGQFGDGSHFDSTSDFWSITDAAQTGLDLTGDYSVVGWGELSNFTNGNRCFLCKSGGAGQKGWAATIDEGGHLMLRATSTFATVSTGGMSLNTWAHMAWVLDTAADTVKYYIAGALDTTITSFTAVPSGNTAACAIGSGDSDRSNWGLATATNNNIDEVLLFSRVVTLTEVQDLMNNGIDSFIGGGGGAKPSRMMMMGIQ